MPSPTMRSPKPTQGCRADDDDLLLCVSSYIIDSEHGCNVFFFVILKIYYFLCLV